MKVTVVKYWNLVSIGILVLGGLWIWRSAAPEGITNRQIPAPMEGFLAPDFELDTLNGERITLSDLRGRVVLLNFWASWCPPCRSEMPAMQDIADAFGSDGFVILAVNSTHQDRLADVENFVVASELMFPILLDTSGQVSTQYQVRSLPTSFFIDREGFVREIVIGGPMAEALLQTRVEDLLKEGE